MKTNRQFRNYQKWDLYESSTDEEEKGEPILPRNDPNFIALEKDMVESQKKREDSRKKALALKDEGNAALKAGKCNKAIRLYSEAIEEFRGLMLLYTNRALAYIKKEEFQLAIADCDKVIEYLEVFEEELKSNKELFVKALTRKAIALHNLKEYTEAKELLKKALEVIPDKEVIKLLETVNLEEEVHLKSLEEIKGDKQQFEVLDVFLEEIKTLSRKEQNIIEDGNTEFSNFENVKVLLKLAENNKYYFIQKGGIETISSLTEKFPQLLSIIDLFNQEKHFTLLLNKLKVFSKLTQSLSRPKEDKLTMTNKDVKTLLGILEDGSQVEEVRKTLSSAKKLDKLFLAALEKFDVTKKDVINDPESVITLMRLFTFVCNIIYSSTTVRDKFVNLSSEIYNKVNIFTQHYDFSNSLNNNLLESILSFLINLSCDANFRERQIGRAHV